MDDSLPSILQDPQVGDEEQQASDEEKSRISTMSPELKKATQSSTALKQIERRLKKMLDFGRRLVAQRAETKQALDKATEGFRSNSTNGNSEISLLTICNTIRDKWDLVVTAWRTADTNKDRLISFQELGMCLEKSGLENVSMKVQKQLWDQIDTDKSGKVDYKEFKAFLDDYPNRYKYLKGRARSYNRHPALAPKSIVAGRPIEGKTAVANVDAANLRINNLFQTANRLSSRLSKLIGDGKTSSSGILDEAKKRATWQPTIPRC